MDFNNIVQQAKPVIKKAATYIQQMALKKDTLSVEEKFKNNLVSEVDRNAELILVEGLSKIIKQTGFLTEEQTVEQTKQEWLWVIDPLDGTTNFLRGVPAYAVSVALMQHDAVVVGLIYDCVQNHLYTAIKGKGAFKNETPIRVNQNTVFEQSFMATGFPYYDFSKAQAYLKVFEHIMHHTLGMRRLGSAALDLCHVATGMYDAYFEYSLHPYDVAAGALLVQEAGGTVTDFSGQDGYIFNQQIIAGNQAIHTKVLELIQTHFEE